MTRKLPLLLAVALTFSAASAAAAQKSPDPKLNDALWEAVRKGDAAAVKSLLDQGADANAKGRYQMTPLFKASERGDVEIVRMLLGRGADVKVRDTFYQATAITWAADKGHAEVVRLLLDKGAGEEGGLQNVLQTGVGRGYPALVKLALARGGLDSDALSLALRNAEEGKQAEIVELLKQAGAKPLVAGNFEVDAATLKSYEGTYRPAQGNELKVAVNPEGKLTVITPTQTYVLGATDKVLFRIVTSPAVVVTFQSEGGQVTGFTLKTVGGPLQVYKRVEAAK